MAIVSLSRMQELMKIPQAARLLLTKSEKEIAFSVNLKVGKDEIALNDVYVVYHNTVLGPAKGGIRFSTSVTLEETRRLATIMTYKNALMGLPFGGGKTGINIDPTKIDEFYRIAMVKEFVHSMRNELYSGDYIPAPDMGSGPSDMAVIYGEIHKPEVVTGKPVRVGGLPGRREATGRGVSTAAAIAAEYFLKKDISDLTVAIQGFGNVGRWTAYFLQERGAKIIAIGDVEGAIFREEGLNIPELMNYAPGKTDTIAGFPGSCAITSKELFNLNVDVLIPAAVENVITKDTSCNIRAGIIIEGANDPTTSEGDAILNERGIPLMPDFLCNSGGVIASYIEWRNAKSGNQTDKQDVFCAIDEKIERILKKILVVSKDMNINYREAAMYLSTSELIEAMRERSWL